MEQHFLQSINCHLGRLVELVEAAQREGGRDLVTRCDLNSAEARLTAAIERSKELGHDDVALLDSLRTETEAQTKKWERLARTPSS